MPDWFAAPAELGLEAEEMFLVPEPGVALHAWFFPLPAPRATLLFCHGNAGNISHRLEWIVPFLARGWGAMLFDYRGFGLSHRR